VHVLSAEERMFARGVRRHRNDGVVWCRRVFRGSARQSDVFQEVETMLYSVADGRNASILCYGAVW
jgi:hypothetical protein